MRGTPTGDDSPHWWRNTCETIKLQALVVYRYGARARLAATHAAWSAADAWLAATHAADDEQMLVMHALHAILEAAACPPLESAGDSGCKGARERFWRQRPVPL